MLGFIVVILLLSVLYISIPLFLILLILSLFVLMVTPKIDVKIYGSQLQECYNSVLDSYGYRYFANSNFSIIQKLDSEKSVTNIFHCEGVLGYIAIHEDQLYFSTATGIYHLHGESAKFYECTPTGPLCVDSKGKIHFVNNESGSYYIREISKGTVNQNKSITLTDATTNLVYSRENRLLYVYDSADGGVIKSYTLAYDNVETSDSVDGDTVVLSGGGQVFLQYDNETIYFITTDTDKNLVMKLLDLDLSITTLTNTALNYVYTVLEGGNALDHFFVYQGHALFGYYDGTVYRMYTAHISNSDVSNDEKFLFSTPASITSVLQLKKKTYYSYQQVPTLVCNGIDVLTLSNIDSIDANTYEPVEITALGYYQSKFYIAATYMYTPGIIPIYIQFIQVFDSDLNLVYTSEPISKDMCNSIVPRFSNIYATFLDEEYVQTMPTDLTEGPTDTEIQAYKLKMHDNELLKITGQDKYYYILEDGREKRRGTDTFVLGSIASKHTYIDSTRNTLITKYGTWSFGENIACLPSSVRPYEYDNISERKGKIAVGQAFVNNHGGNVLIFKTKIF